MRQKKVRAGKREFFVIIERGEDGYYIGSVPSLHGCHTQGKTIDELMKNIQEVILLCLEAQAEDIPQTSDFIGIQKVQV